MKHVAEIIACGVALAWLYGASEAGEIAPNVDVNGVAASTTHSSETTDADSSLLIGDDIGFVSAEQKIPVVAQPEDVDQAKVEKRLEEKSARVKQRIADAEKDVAERNASAQRPQTDGASK